MGGQLDKRMLHWQLAKCCIFQLFIIICYLANKILLYYHHHHHNYHVSKNIRYVFFHNLKQLEPIFVISAQ